MFLSIGGQFWLMIKVEYRVWAQCNLARLTLLEFLKKFKVLINEYLYGFGINIEVSIFFRMTSEISIKVKKLDGGSLDLKLARTSTVSQLKNKIEELTKMPSNRQRIIYHGV